MLTSSGMVIGARLAGAGAGFATQLVLARMLGAHELGLFFIALSLANIIGIVGTLGYPMVTVRFVARYASEKRQALRRKFLSTIRFESLMVSCACALAAAGAIWAWPSDSPNDRYLLILGALIAIPYAVLYLNEWIAISFEKFALGSLPELFFRPVMFAGFVLAVLVSGQAWLSSTFMLLLAFGAITIGLGIGQGRFLRRAEPATKVPLLQKCGRPRIASAWRASAMPHILATMFVAYFADLQTLLTGAFLSASSAAVFIICMKLVALLAFAIQAVYQIVSPEIARSMTDGDTDRLHKSITRCNLLTMAMAGGACAVLSIFGAMILSAFGPEFVEGTSALTGLAVMLVIRAAAGPAELLLTVAGHQRKIMTIMICSLVVLIATNGVLMPLFGLAGGVAAVLGTTAFWTGSLAYQAHRLCGQRTDVLRFVSHWPGRQPEAVELVTEKPSK